MQSNPRNLNQSEEWGGMREVILVRHAQASFGQDDYDQLSALGHQQARRLGLWWKEQGFDRQSLQSSLVTGGLKRHRQTAQNILQSFSETPQDGVELKHIPDLAEFDHRQVFYAFRPELQDPDLREAWQKECGDRYEEEVMNVYRLALMRWMENNHPSEYSESWEDFCRRCDAGWNQALAGHQSEGGVPLVIVTSAGPISALLGRLLNLDLFQIREMQTSLWNSGLTYLQHPHHAAPWQCAEWNVLPHLQDFPEEHTLK